MNIFVLDLDPKKCAEYHCDKHVVKMVLESAQIMCAVADRYGMDSPYKATHKHHPCTIWAGDSISNYLWLRQLAIELGKEYTHRYGKIHKSSLVIESLPIPNIPERGFMKFAQAMPDEYKDDSNFITAYRNYYIGEKSEMLKYTNRNKPDWIK